MSIKSLYGHRTRSGYTNISKYKGLQTPPGIKAGSPSVHICPAIVTSLIQPREKEEQKQLLPQASHIPDKNRL